MLKYPPLRLLAEQSFLVNHLIMFRRNPNLMEMDLTTAFNLFSIPPHARSKDVIVELVRLTSEVQFFKKLAAKHGAKLHAACVKAMTYVTYLQGEAIVKFGEVGDSTYVMLHGAASVLIPFKLKGFRSLKHLSINFDEDLISQALGTTENQDKLRSILCGAEQAAKSGEELKLREVGLIEPGGSFGELSLLTNKPRAATVLAKSDCILVQLTKDDYKQTLQRLENQQIERKIGFLRTITVFSKWTWESMHKLTYFLKSANYRQGAVVFREGWPSEEVFIVKDGEFKFYKQTKTSNDSLFRGQSSIRKSPVKLHTEIKLAKEIFGVDDAIEGRVRGFTCECSSVIGKLYIISKKDFIDLIQKSDSWNYLVKAHSHNEAWREKKLQRISRAEAQFKQLDEAVLITKSEDSLPLTHKRSMAQPNLTPNLIQSNSTRRILPSLELPSPSHKRGLKERSLTTRAQLSIYFESSEERSMSNFRNQLGNKTELQWKHSPLPHQKLAEFKASKAPRNFFASGKLAIISRYQHSPRIVGLEIPASPKGALVKKKIELKSKLARHA